MRSPRSPLFSGWNCVANIRSRPIIDATLAQLGEALSAGQTLAVPPLGRGRVNLEKDLRGGDVITLRLRRKPAS